MSIKNTEDRTLKLSRLRRIVLLIIVALFLLQFFRINVLVGGLSGAIVVWSINLIDVFAYLESLAASRYFTTTALIAVIPIVWIYLILGRAFCGWVCPMDFLFEIINRIRKWKKMALNISPKIGYGIAAAFLAGSLILGIPLFTNYFSHLTNFFRAITSGVFLAFDLPVEPVVLMYSGGAIFLLLGLEYFFPRLWCKVLCPVGKTYGLFNKVSLLKLKFVKGECHRCGLCEQVCYMDVKLARYVDQPNLRDTDCIYCGRCVEGCESKGKLIKMKIGWWWK